MKRILHVVGGMDRAGAETMLMNLYRKLDRTEYQFDFVYFRNSKCDFDDEILELGGRIFKIENKNPISRTISLKRLIVRESPFHAVHCHMLFSNAFHILAAYFAKVDMRISHSHNTSDVNSNSLLGRMYQRISKLIMRRYSTHFIACGDAAGNFLFPKVAKIEYLLNAIDVELFSKNRLKNRSFLKDELKLDNDTIIITQIGRIAPVKNHDFTLEFAKHLLDRKIKFKVVIVGSGPLKDDLIKMVKKNNLNDYVVFLGVRSDIPLILAGTDLMLMPSIHEGFPVVLVESQATGVPSLIADTISKEVDLGLELIKFESLDNSFLSWEEKMYELYKQKETSFEERINVLSEKGFNIVNSVKKLEKIYG